MFGLFVAIVLFLLCEERTILLLFLQKSRRNEKKNRGWDLPGKGPVMVCNGPMGRMGLVNGRASLITTHSKAFFFPLPHPFSLRLSPSVLFYQMELKV